MRGKFKRFLQSFVLLSLLIDSSAFVAGVLDRDLVRQHLGCGAGGAGARLGLGVDRPWRARLPGVTQTVVLCTCALTPAAQYMTTQPLKNICSSVVTAASVTLWQSVCAEPPRVTFLAAGAHPAAAGRQAAGVGRRDSALLHPVGRQVLPDAPRLRVGAPGHEAPLHCRCEWRLRFMAS